ncbi:hypothetical protein QF026_007834 [Streptomyces aurantiacus]|uniref:hypothetical protein n=1 Tax=Streptomyces aurantiacus TaxID=47760 RepID=UPI00278D089D|nr:hypothetical protein [Streptomyces aurantiacus]MDQ0779368.1 hypothetical protein [Streptomyces aurantiacus]
MSRTGKRAAGVGGLVAVLAAACLGWAVWAVASSERHVGEDARAGDARSRAVKVPCREALRFADQERLPAGARDAACVMQHGIDTLYDVRFRISKTGLDAWLADTYPDMKLDSACVEDDADRCGHLDLHPYVEGGAVALELTVRDESDGSALVHFKPFNT